MPSRTEGLPRAMIEAMTGRCLASEPGLAAFLACWLMKSGRSRGSLGLANKIREVVTNPMRLWEMSARNLKRAQDYRPEILDKRRNEFYRFLRQATENWLSTQTKPRAKGATA